MLNYFGVESPELIENLESASKVILVDHANYDESIDNLSNMEILKVVDHHRTGLNTSSPLFYRAEPVRMYTNCII